MTLIGSVAPLDAEPKISEARFEVSDILAIPGGANVPLSEARVVRDATCVLNGVTNEMGWSPR